jgi:NAD(P)H-hydrate epimerase
MTMEHITDLPKIPRRPRDGHKGSFGRVLVVGGSRRMIGAPALAANAALRGGAGLVVIASPANVQFAVAMLSECATSIPLKCQAAGDLAPEAVAQVLEAADKCDVLAVGPGFAVGARQQDIVRAALEQAKPVVIDADGLNNLAKIDNWPALRRCPLILTPHPGEFSRLTGRHAADIQADREGAAETAVLQWRAASDDSAKNLPLILVLKGAGTVVTDAHDMYVNDTGNPGMATGGSGDILTGLMAAMTRQGLGLMHAVCLAVRVHGRAGDLAAQDLGEQALIASDLLDTIGDALMEVSE